MIKPDFSSVKDLFLSYPEGFDEEFESLTGFYAELIGKIPENIRLFLLVNNTVAGERILGLYPNKYIHVICIKDFDEIWLRDIMGINTGTDRIYKPAFSPDYFKHVYTSSYLEMLDEQVREIFARSIKTEVIDMPLVMDGGNIVTNGKIALVTDKILLQNEKNGSYVGEIIRNYLGVNPIFLKTNKYDKLGHTDGFLAFLNPQNVCISSYPGNMPTFRYDNQYIQEITSILENEGINTVKLKERPIDERVKGGIVANDHLHGVRGVYVNFLQLNDTVILPEYSLPYYKKEMDYNLVNKSILEAQGKKVITINCDVLGKMGGSLHCISFTN